MCGGPLSLFTPLPHVYDPLLSVTIFSQTLFSLFPSHIRRVWVSERGKKSRSPATAAFHTFLVFICGSLGLSICCNLFRPIRCFSLFPSPGCCCCCWCGGGGGGEERRAGCLNRRAKKKLRGTVLSLSLSASLSIRQCVPPSLPPSFSQSSPSNYSLPTASSMHAHTCMQARLHTHNNTLF